MTDQTAEMDVVRAERRRQIEVEGWTPEHDNEHENGEMLTAAVIYLHHGTKMMPVLPRGEPPLGWPWDRKWFKPKDRRSNLIRAGALCLAEKERLARRGTKYDGHVDHKLNLVLSALQALPQGTET